MGAERFFSEHPWESGRTGPEHRATHIQRCLL